MRWRLILAAALSLAAFTARAEPDAREVALVIGPSRSVVREMRQVAFTANVCEVRFDGIPASADLTTLQVGGERQGVTLLKWQREVAKPPAMQSIRWSSGEVKSRLEPVELPTVRCTLESSSQRTRWVELVYQVEGLAWRADYEIIIRGDIANHVEPLSLDLEGRLIISNATERLFPNAQILLVGEDRSRAAAQTGMPPGKLMLDETSPLADLWRARHVEPGIQYGYPMQGMVTLQPFAEVSVSFAKMRRQAADRIYRLESDEAPLNAGDAWHPLARLLSLPNDSAHGLGMLLPPGDALVYLGGVRGGPYQRALLRHTPSKGDLRINLGDARGVTATRRIDGRIDGPAGMPEQTIHVGLANALPTPVNVEVVERPPVPLAWDIVRSSHAFEKVDERLLFKLQLEPRSEIEVEYTVRTTEPNP